MTERTCYSVLKGHPEVLTVTEAAKILRLGKNKTYNLVNSGRLSSIKVGGKIIIPKTCLVSFLLDTKNYQFQSPVIPDNRWISGEQSDIMCSTDRATKAFVVA